MNNPLFSRFYYQAPFCDLYFTATSLGITSVRFSRGSTVNNGFDFASLACELDAYFSGMPVSFSAPYVYNKSTFAGRVLSVLRKTLFGTMISYGELAAKAGFSGAARAVGTVMANKPLPLLIPCHRVITSDKKLGGFSSGIGLKRKLLRLEGVCL